MAAPNIATMDDVARSEALIRDLSAQAIQALTAPDMQSADRQRVFRELLAQNFAMNAIARFALGRYWRRIEQADKQEYIGLFEDLIVVTWADRFLEYSGQAFDVVGAEPVRLSGKDTVTLVNSVFFTAPDVPVEINWRVSSNGTVFRITDVAVQGVSMSQTYRDEFASVVRKNGVNGLLADLRQRAAELN